MSTKEELLEKAQVLNNEEKYSEVIELLPNDLLEKRNDADLYAEKAQAYYRLREKALCRKAIEKALNINPNQAKAIHYNGNICCDLKKFDEAIKYFNQAIEYDPKYANSYNGLGNVYRGLKEYDKAIENFNQAIKFDPFFSHPYNGLGNVYYDLKEYNKAIEYYCKAIDLDPKLKQPYNGLGNVYKNLKAYKKAIKNYSEAIKLDSNYTSPYNGLGNVYKGMKEYDNAIKNYEEAIKLNPEYSSPYYNRAIVYKIKNEYKKALKDFEKYIEITKDETEYFVLQAKSFIEELNKYTSSDFISIKQLVQKIKDSLLIKDSSVAHYTSLTATKAMILNDSKFRLSECAFLNDPSEGRELFEFLNIQEACTTKGEINCPMPFAQKPFIGSFVSNTKQDDLTLWRMYGKESKEEAKGCSITIDSKKFQESLRDEVLSKTKIDTDQIMSDDFNFYRMVYRTQDQDNPFVVPGAKDEEKVLNDTMNKLENITKVYKTKYEKDSKKIKDLFVLLNSIAYLFKSAEYQYEHEIRMVVDGVGFEKVIKGDNVPVVYLETVPINPIIQKITLGPKVERAEEWAAAFYYKLDKQDLRPEIFISHLPFK